MTTPTLYDFWAPWCGPCKAMKPTIDALEAKMAGQLTVRRVNVDDEPQLAEQLGIKAIPTLVLVKPGQGEVMRLIGAKPAVLEAMVGGALEPASTEGI